MNAHSGLAIFDLDNTLLLGDSDYLWGEYLVEHKIVDRDHYQQENKRFYEEYEQGLLDIYEFLDFALKPLAENSLALLNDLHKSFMFEKILPIIPESARALVEDHRDKNHTLLIITATNRFVTAPIAAELGIENLLATEPEMLDGQYTGKVQGVPCFQEGKVTQLNTWLKENNVSLQQSWFYSDSHNDLPLLLKVTYPFAVNPDETLEAHAEQCQWPIIRFN
ncbi:Phosphoserine phosphatase [hydrothermal vent metagenome]|uniref:Phosphoserine phosphatase n=1 Tax=hydrothermal vent metagenome TaxID=652676 RepID=A0A3B0ZF16_9ZZZZ